MLTDLRLRNPLSRYLLLDDDGGGQGGSGGGDGGSGGGDGGDKKFTQADIDAAVKNRLKREQTKFADYDAIKAERDALVQKQSSGGDESTQLKNQLAKLEEDLKAERVLRMRTEVAASKGLTPAQAKRLSGSTLEELESDADDLLEAFPAPKGDKGDGDGQGESKTPPGGKPREQLRTGTGGGEGPAEETDVKKLGARMFE